MWLLIVLNAILIIDVVRGRVSKARHDYWSNEYLKQKALRERDKRTRKTKKPKSIIIIRKASISLQ